MPSFDSSTVRGRIDTLTANLRRVRAGKAYGIDEDGALIGEALKSSFKGKVVDLLVARGIAKQGNLGGRIAIALVGRQNFDLIRDAHADPGHRGSIANALALIEKYELAGVDDAGLDRDIASRVTSRVASDITLSTPLRALAGGRVADVHDAIWNDVVPRRLAWRAELANDVNNGNLTKSIADAGQVALDEAARAILDGRTAPGQLTTTRQASGGQGNFKNQAEHIVADYNQAVYAVRTSAAEGEDADARVAAFTDRFLGVLKDQYESLDVADGIGPRIDGTVSRPIKSDHAAEEFEGGKTPFRSQARLAAEGAGVAVPDKRAVTFAGGKPDESPGDVASERTARQRLLDGVRAVLDDPDVPSAHELREAAGDLGNVLGDRSADIEDKRTAVELLSNPVFHGNFENVVLAIDKVDRAAIRHPEIAQAFAGRVHLQHLRGVVEKERAFVDDLDAHPENHEDLLAEYREVHGADRAESEIGNLISSTRRSAARAMTSLDAFARVS
ncbi:MAG: hypothetical protein OXH68_00605 [Gammaproteobacteria bacterium]|nr:hypothetical protein [Gammaproteobacteria bacterium]